MSKITWKPQTEINKEKLTSTREAKISQLKAACTAAIFEGFDSPSMGKSFGFNELDQTNFTQQAVMIVSMGGPNAYTAPIQWKTKAGEVVTLTATQFAQLTLEAQKHKETQQRKYWSLEVNVKSADTVEQIEAINW